MLSDTLLRRVESIPILSRQVKRINGLSRIMTASKLWLQAFEEIAPSRGAAAREVTDDTLDGVSLGSVVFCRIL